MEAAASTTHAWTQGPSVGSTCRAPYTRTEPAPGSLAFVPYAFVEDIAASWEHYQRFAAALEGSTPEGLILHAAGPTDEGFRIIGIWESEDAWRRFRENRLDPSAETVAQVPPTFRELRPRHLVRPASQAAAGSAAATRANRISPSSA